MMMVGWMTYAQNDVVLMTKTELFINWVSGTLGMKKEPFQVLIVVWKLSSCL